MTRPWLVIGEGISLAHVSRAALVAAALRDAGEPVVLATGPKYAPWLRQRGEDPRVVWTPDPDEVYDRLRRLKPMLTRAEVERSARADLSLIEQTNPHAVVGDCRNSLRISAAKAGVPYAALTNANTTPWYAGPLVLPIAACPPHRPRRWIEHRLPGLVRRLQDAGCRRLAKPFAAAARSFGVDRDCADFRRVFTSDDLTLLADDPAFSPSDNLPDHARYVGPLFVERDPVNEAATRAALAELDLDAGKPLVVLSTGSTGRADQLPDALAAFARHGWQVVLIGHAAQRVRADAAPSTRDVVGIPFADPGVLLPHAAAMICHGGNGSIYQALRYGVPVFSLPTFFDQQTQAVLSEAAGIGCGLHHLQPDRWPEHLTGFAARRSSMQDATDQRGAIDPRHAADQAVQCLTNRFPRHAQSGRRAA